MIFKREIIISREKYFTRSGAPPSQDPPALQFRITCGDNARLAYLLLFLQMNR